MIRYVFKSCFKPKNLKTCLIFTKKNEISSLVVVEHNFGKLKPSTLSVITAAKQLGGDMSAVVGGYEESSEIARQISKIDGIKKVYLAKHKCLEHQLPEPMADVLYELQQKKNFSHLFGPATAFGKSLMPRLSAKLDIQQVSDIIEIIDKDTYSRPIYAGRIIETVQYIEDGNRVITVRPSVYEPEQKEQDSCEIEELTEDYYTSAVTWSDKVQFISFKKPDSEKPDLATAKIVIAGGRGLKSAEGFKIIERIAKKLNAAVGATRAAVDAGWVSNDLQVGQTGKVISPDVYIAVGISGAIQHLAGINNAKTIISINSDPDAPIHKIADYRIIKDLFEALAELEELIDKEMNIKEN